MKNMKSKLFLLLTINMLVASFIAACPTVPPKNLGKIKKISML